jgi:hypothetical protein
MHAAVLQHPLKMHDIVAQFSFKLDGGKMTAFSLNDTHGHVCRAVVNPAGFALQKDKANKTSTDKPQALDRSAGAIKPGEWHTMVVEVRGKEMLATLDGGQRVAFGANDGIDVDKTVLAFPVSGDSVQIAHVRVWEAKPKADWDATKAKLQAAKSNQASSSK